MRVPSDWRSVELPVDLSALTASSFSSELGGRDAERDVLWKALRGVDRGEGARAVVLRGPAGSGKSALGRWLVERAHELGAAWQLQATHHETFGANDGIGGMFSMFLRTVGLTRDQTIARLNFLLRLRPGSGAGVAELVSELMVPAAASEPVSVRLTTSQERVVACLAGLQVLTGVIGGEGDPGPRRSVVALVDDAQWGPEALELVQMALTGRAGLPTPLLFLIAVNTDALDSPGVAAQLASIEAMEGADRIDLAALPSRASPRRVAHRVDTFFPAADRPEDVIDPLEHAIKQALTSTRTGDH